MKKTILALTLASVFAAPAFAMETENHDINGAVLETKINELGEKGYTRERNEDGSWMVKDASGETVARVQTTKTGLEVLSSDGVSVKKDVYNVYETNNDVIEDDTGEAQAEANRNAIEN
ncbi:hypothetical protein [Vibrio chagasii]|uniref:hypothetical protein n=1 Tax=Vibrio chagasii TaxID=170679 RepID=UPI003736681D